MERSIFVVSDLHLGDGGPRDNFGVDDKDGQFCKFLDFVERENGELFILGDLFEFWQANIGRVIRRRMDLIDRFAEMKAAYIVGNHDADFEDLIGTGLFRHPFFEAMSGPFERTIGPKRFKFMHGHEVEPMNRDGTPKWGRILSILCGIIEDRKGSPLLSAGGTTEKTLLNMGRSFMWMYNNSINLLEKSEKHERPHSVAESLTPTQDPHKTRGILKLYQQDRRQNGYDLLVTGHTHRGGLFKDWYANSGCWVGLRNHFLRIDPDASIHFFEWNQCGPLLVEGEKKEIRW